MPRKQIAPVKSTTTMPVWPQSTSSLQQTSQTLQFVEFDLQAGPQVVLNENRAEPTGKDVPTGPKGWPCRVLRQARQSPYVAAALASLIVGILALIILPTVLHKLSVDGGPSAVHTTHTTSSTPCPGCDASATLTSLSPSETTSAIDRCTDMASWTANVSYMGIAVNGAKSWPYKLFPSTNAADCCKLCFVRFPAGCQGWAFLPWRNTPVPCTIIYGWNSTLAVSIPCPNGIAQIGFATDTSYSGSVGSTGPCGYASMTTTN